MGLFSFIGSLIGGGKAKKSADAAAKLQYDAATQGIAESARQFDITNENYAPYRELGASAVDGFSDLAGLSGDEAQTAALASLRQSPLYQTLYRTGEEAILANASATGGIRGGNMQRSLADFGSDTFASAIERELAMLGGAIGIGANAVGATGQFGQQAVSEQNDLRNRGAEAQAQAKLVRGGINQGNWNNAGSLVDSALSAVTGGFNFGKLF